MLNNLRRNNALKETELWSAIVGAAVHINGFWITDY